MPLLTKIQFNNFETGEFTEEKERTLEETIQLIEAFPWEPQRKNLQVGLTNPSITIEGQYHHFLKLSLYYHGSFVLYYLDDADRLYLKSFQNYQQAYSFLTAFFEDSLLDTAGWEHQHNWLQGKRIHFVDKDFRYTLKKPVLIGFFSLGCLYLLFILTTTIAMLMQGGRGHRPFFFVSIPLVFFLILGILLIAQFVNQWRSASGKELILSKGKDIFYYGGIGHPQAWSKQDIQAIWYVSPRKLQSGKFGNFIRIDLKPKGADKDFASLYLPSVLIKDRDALSKFPSVQARYTRKLFPFIPPDPSVPS
jgi:hypothetical protein